MAKKSIIVASIFGLLATGYTALTGDESAYTNASTQPMKLAAYEGFWDGEEGAAIVAIGFPNRAKKPGNDEEPFHFEISIPKGLALLANRELNGFVPGINDLVYGNEKYGIMPVAEKMERGKTAIADLTAFKEAGKAGDEAAAEVALEKFKVNEEYLGYGYLKTPEETLPPVIETFYAFHIMVYLGVFFLVIFVLFLIAGLKDTLLEKKWLLRLGVSSFFLGMIASQAGWIVSEVGRQPWAIQDLMPVSVATTNIAAGHVMATFFIFLSIFTALLIAEIAIMLRQIKIGPEGA